MMADLAGSLDSLTDPYEIVSRIRAYAGSKNFLRMAEATATKMVTHLFSDSGRTWRQAARANSQGRMIFEALRNEMHGPVGTAVREKIRSNAKLISTLPLDIAQNVTEHILEESMKGKRASTIAQEIRQLFPDESNARAKLIARTEVSKASTALTEARSERLGIKAYQWHTSEDQRVRDSHRLMDDVIVFWDDPPAPEQLDGKKHTFGHYHAGEIFNCRCYAAPIIDLDMISWPAKVYRNGKIQTVTRAKFERITS